MTESIRQPCAASKLSIHPHNEKPDLHIDIPSRYPCIVRKCALISKAAYCKTSRYNPDMWRLEAVFYTLGKILYPWCVVSFCGPTFLSDDYLS